MSFAGVSAIANGELLGSGTSPTFNAYAASGYHLLVVQGYSIKRGLIESHSFTIGGQRWCIHYMPQHGDNVGSITLFLSLVESTKEPIKAQFEFSFVNQTDKQEPASIHDSEIFEFRTSKLKVIEREALEKHLKDDSFTIRCDIVVVNPTCGTSRFVAVPPSNMQQNFTDLLLAGQGTDVVFCVGGKTITAHRCVLAARSTVFRAALFGPMQEGTSSSIVQIDDMDAPVFKAMLEFIYGDTLHAMKESKDEVMVLLQHLLVAADRYNLQRLRLMCEKNLCEHIGVDMVTSILALAEQHGCHGLKKACCEFLWCPDNLRAVVDTDGFDHLCRSCPPLL
ncbi:BTB/POZ and MATH domain-containing protein 1-like [Triticum dicoccoides]|uniref:Uncharacterized protein n=1 Tax=Triticum turgidum subsp. durum TaxID=4567 RepID=A0A9R1ACY4_TRITD|nr:BTB/POZ and MATH domain-containing protein 1-like [Triticum dicoccoides]VAI93907.1 unnamed protein product [Triticum turgidum subsp. durum]